MGSALTGTVPEWNSIASTVEVKVFIDGAMQTGAVPFVYREIVQSVHPVTANNKGGSEVQIGGKGFLPISYAGYRCIWRTMKHAMSERIR
jgi:hypothetical protein